MFELSFFLHSLPKPFLMTPINDPYLQCFISISFMLYLGRSQTMSSLLYYSRLFLFFIPYIPQTFVTLGFLFVSHIFLKILLFLASYAYPRSALYNYYFQLPMPIPDLPQTFISQSHKAHFINS